MATYNPRKALLLPGSKRILQYPNDDVCLGTLDELLAAAHRRKLSDNQKILVTVQERCRSRVCTHKGHSAEDNGHVYRFPYERWTVAELKETYKSMTTRPFDYDDRRHQGSFISFKIDFGVTGTDPY